MKRPIPMSVLTRVSPLTHDHDPELMKRLRKAIGENDRFILPRAVYGYAAAAGHTSYGEMNWGPLYTDLCHAAIEHPYGAGICYHTRELIGLLDQAIIAQELRP